MKKIVKGNDFTMLVRVMKIVDGGRVPFSLPSCEEVRAFAVGLYRRHELAARVSASDDSVLLCRVEGDALPLGNYALEVSGKLFGNDWRSNEYGQFRLVDSNAEADTEFSRDLVEGEDSVEMDTAIVFLPPEAGLVELSERLRAGVLDDVRREIAGSLPVVDAELSVESSNAVMNRAVSRALAEMREDMDFLHFVAMQRIGGKKEFTAKDFLGGQTRIAARAFQRYTELEKVTIPDGVTSIGERAFNKCSALKEIHIPDTVTSIGYGAFMGCNSIERAILPDSVTDMGDAVFCYCSSLREVSIPKGAAAIGDYAFGKCTSLKRVTVPDGVARLGRSAFSACTSMEEIILPESVSEISERAFQDCRSLAGVKIPDGVTRIGEYTFSGCRSVKKFVIPDGVKSIGVGAFNKCSALTSITIPESVAVIDEYAFQDCTSLAEVTIPEGVTDIKGNIFFRSTSLTRILVDTGNRTYDSRNGCNAVIETATGTLIAGCKGTIIPDGVTKIGYSAFAGCGITEITIPDGVIGVYNYALSYNTSLASVTIPESVTSIGEGALKGCTSLTAVTYKGTKAQWGNVSKGNDWNINTPTDAVVHCTDGDVPLNG